MQLASDMDLVCRDLKQNRRLSISRFRLAGIKQQILSNSYIIAPLLVKFIKQGDLTDYLDRNLPDSPDNIMVSASISSKHLRVMRPNNKEDSLVLLALSVTLLRVLQGGLPNATDWTMIASCQKTDTGWTMEFLPSMIVLKKLERLRDL